MHRISDVKNTPLALLLLSVLSLSAQDPSGKFQHDVVKTGEGQLEMYFIGHGTLMFKWQGKVIHIDPVMREADYASLPDADLILVTHQHGDHLDRNAIDQILKDGTEVVMTEICKEQLENFEAIVMHNGDHRTLAGISIEALPAYNIQHKRSNGKPYHPKGEGNAYLLVFGDTKVLIGGDTENVPELKALDQVDIAFLPMNLPYTMTPEMVADAALSIRPKILYPYHYGSTDPQELVRLLAQEPGIEVRIRELQ